MFNFRKEAVQKYADAIVAQTGNLTGDDQIVVEINPSKLGGFFELPWLGGLVSILTGLRVATTTGCDNCAEHRESPLNHTLIINPDDPS